MCSNHEMDFHLNCKVFCWTTKCNKVSAYEFIYAEYVVENLEQILNLELIRNNIYICT